MTRRIPFPIGQRFGNLIVTGVARHDATRGNYFLSCLCDCGSTAAVREDCLKTGNTRSCGCLHAKAVYKKHGQHNSRTYRIWAGMKSRCSASCPKKKSHLYYEKGIRVCDRWMLFENFLEDMGFAPKGMTIERIDGNKGYEPSNCKWATFKEQANNTTKNVRLSYDGKVQTIRQWASEIGIKENTINYRMRRGWSHEKALTVPVQQKQTEKLL